MIPDYLTFIRFQDKRFLPFLYLLVGVMLGFYWKNNGYAIERRDIWLVCGILALIFFNCINDLKAYWAYKCVINNIDLSYFHGRSFSRLEKALSSPLAAGTASYMAFWLLAYGCLALPSTLLQLGGLFLFSPLVAWLLFWLVRHSYVKQVGSAAVEKVRYRHLRGYVCLHLLFTLTLNVLTLVPLKNSADFSLGEGFLSARLMVATLILCAIVLALNLAFTRLNKSYVFLGRLFLNEIDLYFSSSLPCRALWEKPFWIRMILLLTGQTLWIAALALILTFLGWNICFEAWFLLCFMPAAGYCYLHVYWRWHEYFMMSCDMYLRWGEIDKQADLW